jgi:VanZ family protein
MRISALRTAARLATLVSAGVILYFTLTPSPPGAGLLQDWLGHFLLFIPLGAAAGLWWATSSLSRRSPRRTLLMLILALWVFAAATELAQAYVGRDTDLGDWVADMAGALTGLFGGSALARWILTR